MKMKNKLLVTLFIVYYEIKQYFIRIASRIWFFGVKNKRNKLWIRENEFHKSLDMDGRAMSYMNEKEKEKYITDLVKRRNKAHERDYL